MKLDIANRQENKLLLILAMMIGKMMAKSTLLHPELMAEEIRKYMEMETEG